MWYNLYGDFMKTLKRICLLILLFGIIVVLTSCEKSYNKIKHIAYYEILSLDEKEYYVFIHMPDCAICKTIEEDIYNYYKKAKRSNNLPNLYVVNRGEKENYDALTQTGYYKDDDYSHLIGCKNVEEIKLCTSPVMFKIKNQTIIGIYDEQSLITNELGIEVNNE